MSEEKKQNTNHGSRNNHRRRHHHHKNKNHRDQQSDANVVQNNVQGNTENAINKKHNQHQKNAQKNAPSDLSNSIPETDFIFGDLRTGFVKEKKSPAISSDFSDIRQFSDEELFGTSHLINSKEISDEAST